MPELESSTEDVSLNQLVGPRRGSSLRPRKKLGGQCPIDLF